MSDTRQVSHGTLLSVAQVARRLEISDETVRRYFDAGLLHGMRLGPRRERFVYADSLDRLAHERRPKGGR